MNRDAQTTALETSSAAAKPAGGRREVVGICAVLVILVLMVFGQTFRHGFVNYDDNEYVYENPIVTKGIALENIGWAFTHVHAANWHPLTTLSHMLDCQFYGLWAGGHHLTNLLLHAAVAVLLFLMLREMTGALWRSAFMAAVFAIHPLRVESVAWVAERKDVLSGVFFMLTLWAYTRYTRRPKSKTSYALVLLWFILGLMSKPMLVTLPFVLLLLDCWPLGRLQQKSQLPRLLWEKLPLFALSILSCVATVIAQKEAIAPLEYAPLSLRISNALVAYVVYLGKMIYPARLAVLYPWLKHGWPAWKVIAAMLVLSLLTAGAWVLRKKQPYLLVGWLWYMGMLVPVIGILQVGQQAYADRYTYLPQIGLCLAVTWAMVDWAGERRRMAICGLAVTVIGVLLAMSYHQTSYWRDSKPLWTHTLGCTQDNAIACSNLGGTLLQQGLTADAITQLQEALRIHPAFLEAQINLGNALFQQGRAKEAIVQVQKALERQPFNPAIQNNLAWMLATAPQAALRNGARAVELATQASHSSGGNNPLILETLAAAYAVVGDFSNAVQTTKKALQLAETQPNAALAAALRRELQLYEAGQPFHESP